MDFLKPDAFFDLASFDHRDVFAGCKYVWDTLSNISGYLEQRLEPNVGGLKCFRRPLPKTIVMWQGETLEDGFEIIGGDVTKGEFRVRIGGEETTEAAVLYEGSVLWDEAIFIGPGAVVEPGALVKGPSIIGAQTEVRQGAYIRGKCIVGARCVVGHTTEMKSSIMLDGAKAGHFAYIGDSVLGNEANLGAGTKLANLKIERPDHTRDGPRRTYCHKSAKIRGDHRGPCGNRLQRRHKSRDCPRQELPGFSSHIRTRRLL